VSRVEDYYKPIIKLITRRKIYFKGILKYLKRQKRGLCGDNLKLLKRSWGVSECNR
jgi:hypothetical protein